MMFVIYESVELKCQSNFIAIHPTMLQGMHSKAARGDRQST